MAENARTSRVAEFGKRVAKFFRDIRNELKKVIWPTKSQVIKNTISVLAICFMIGIVIWISDGILQNVVNWVLSR